jgi:hypothetical protein
MYRALVLFPRSADAAAVDSLIDGTASSFKASALSQRTRQNARCSLTYRAVDSDTGDVVTSLDGLPTATWIGDDTIAGSVLTDEADIGDLGRFQPTCPQFPLHT